MEGIPMEIIDSEGKWKMFMLKFQRTRISVAFCYNDVLYVEL